jgi:lysophospholipase L1-like esterase
MALSGLDGSVDISQLWAMAIVIPLYWAPLPNQFRSVADLRVDDSRLESSAHPDQRTSKTHIALGDSVTACYGVDAHSNCYTRLLSEAENATLTSFASNGVHACDTSYQAFVPEAPPSTNVIYTLMIGTNDANNNGRGPYEAVYRSCHQAVMAWLALPVAGKLPASQCTTRGEWMPEPAYHPHFGLKSNRRGASLTCSVISIGAPIYAWFRLIDGTRGQFSCSVDGGNELSLKTFTSPPIGANGGGREGMGFVRIPGLSAGTHIIRFTVRSEAAPDTFVSIYAVGTATKSAFNGRLYSAGVPKFAADEKADDTAAYDRDAAEDAMLLAADGLPITFVDVRKHIVMATDMTDSLHPNASGHAHLRDAFLQAELANPPN